MDRRIKVYSSECTLCGGTHILAKRLSGIFSHFSQVRGKSRQLPRIPLLHPRRTWWSDCNSTCRTNSCGETSKSSYNGIVLAGRKKKGEESEEKRKRRIACVFRSIWYFFHNAYTVDFFAVIVTCTCHPRLFSAARTFNLHWMSLKSRASIYWVFSSVKIFHRTCLSRRQEAVHRQAFSERRCITVQRDIIRNSPALKIFFSHLKENTSLQATRSTSFYKKKIRTNDAI